MAVQIGTMMPSRRPASEGNEDFVIRQDALQDQELYLADGLTPRRLKMILRLARMNGEVGRLYDVYDRMQTHGSRISSNLNQLKSAISGLPLKIVPAKARSEGEKELAEDYARVAREMLSGLNDTHSLTRDFCDPFFTGASLYQTKWEMREYAYKRKMWFPRKVKPVEGKHLRMHTKRDPSGRASDDFGKMELSTYDNPQGVLVENLPAESVIFLEDGTGRGRYHKQGAARALLPWYLGVQFNRSWWIQFNETYGSPHRIGKYPRGAKAGSKQALEHFLQVLGQRGYGLFPSDMEIDLVEANNKNSTEAYNDFLRKAHGEYDLALLGQRSTNGGENSSSYASMSESQTIRYEVIENVASFVSKGFESALESTLRINYGNDYNRRLAPSVSPLIVRAKDATKKVDALTKMQNEAGVPVPLAHWYEQMGVEEPREGEEAMLHGQVYIHGVDERPEPQERREGRPADAAESGREADAEGDLSVSNAD